MASLLNPRLGWIVDLVRQVYRRVRRLEAQLGGFAGSSSNAADPTCDHIAGLSKKPPLVRGKVIRSGIGSYDCEVVVGDGTTVVCSTLAPVLSDIYGASQACMPIPGSMVLVFIQSVGLPDQSVSRGVILGVLPENNTGGVSVSGSAGLMKFGDTDFPEGGVAQYTESGPKAIASDKSFLYKGEFQCGRAHDIVPGEYAVLNHAGAGLVIGALSTEVRGSGTASIRCSALDDQVRIVSGHYRHISAAGSEEIYNDGGYITVESSVSMYQPERLGVKRQDTKALDFNPGSVNLLQLQDKSSGVKMQVRGQTAKKRFYRYSGYLGDIVNVFVANPDPSKDVESMESGSKDQGLFHTHVDASGRFTMRSAGGVLLERYDRIPIPKRKHYAWDPEGDKSGAAKPEKKKPFTVKDKHPMGIGVTLGDMAAWWDHLSYARFRQFGEDFTVPKQSDLKVPDNDYDAIGEGSEEYQQYDARHSYIGLTPDGGIVLRDAWGSEIVMADGRITLNAAANIEIRSGSSVVVMGGDDVVAKAFNSVDISATNKDLRLKAEKNLQAVSMKNGILLQSKAEKDDTPDWKLVGEQLESTGVVIKADASSVMLVGKKAALQGTDGINLAAFDKDGVSGDITLAGRQISAVAKDRVVMAAGKSSGIVVSEQTALLCSPTVLAVGGQSEVNTSGNQMLIGIPVKVGNMYDQVVSICKSLVGKYLEKMDWLNPLPPKDVSSVNFRFRTSEQYGTLESSGLAGGVFSVYEPSWAVLAEAKRKWMSDCRLKAWEEKPDEKGGYPWPGEKVIGDGYFTYSEMNIDKSTGVENPSKSEAQLTKAAFSSYHIRERK